MSKAFDVLSLQFVLRADSRDGRRHLLRTGEPTLLGFGEDTPEYPFLLGSYCRQAEAHLRAKGWLDQAYIYWFDEPNAGQHPYLQNGFNKLKQYLS